MDFQRTEAISYVCYEYIADNVTCNSSFTARNCSQASLRQSKGSQHRHDLEMGVVGEVELEAPTSNGQNEVIESSCAVEVVVVRDIQEGTPETESRHEYEELELENLITMPTPTRGLSTLRREHDYEDPDVEPSDSKEPVAKSTKAHEYEEPINNAWKRLSMPALNSVPLPTHNVPRRNSTASELFRSTGIESKKPAKIFHYAEFSLYPSQNTSGGTPQPHLSTSPHCNLGSTHPREPNQYEEPSCTTADRHHPLCLGPIPAPTRLLRSASDYEVPLMINATKKGSQSIRIRPPQSVMRQVKLTLERLSQSMNGNSKDDEEAEKLIDGESDTTPDQLKSPESCILSGSGSCRSQEDNEGNVSLVLSTSHLFTTKLPPSPPHLLCLPHSLSSTHFSVSPPSPLSTLALRRPPLSILPPPPSLLFSFIPPFALRPYRFPTGAPCENGMSGLQNVCNRKTKKAALRFLYGWSYAVSEPSTVLLLE